MKALSVKQPWASLITLNIKPIENRTWKTNFRGRVYIHASASVIKEVDFTTQQTAELFENGIWHPESGFKSELNITSAIIGEVDIVDCMINHESIWAEKMAYDVCPRTGLHILRKGQKYIWNWVLANPVHYDQPILNVKGKLSFWDFKPTN